VVRKRWAVWVFVVVFGTLCSAVQRGGDGSGAAEKYIGTWSGTWDGGQAGSGGFELTLEKGKEGGLAGSVSVTGEPTYKAALKTVAFDGSKMTAKYDFPPDEAAEVVLVATFEGSSADGKWTVREKASGSDVFTGTWTVKRK
jgi:hypothetical protein